MEQFFQILTGNSFVQNALIAGVLASVACGITGTFVVVKRISYIGGGIAHAVMGGLGIAYFFNFDPLIGALAFAVVSALLISFVRIKLAQNEDTIISALWAVGMAIGIIFSYLTPGYNVDLQSFLFGNILMITGNDLILLTILDIVIVLFTLIFYRQILFVCFDEEYAALRGINVNNIYILLLIMIALTVVVLVQTVGLILVIALITLPSAISRLFVSTIHQIIIISVSLILLFTFIGFLVSFALNLPSGATIILFAGIAYLAAFSIKILRTRFN